MKLPSFLLAATLIFTQAQPTPVRSQEPSTEQSNHVLSRLTFGARPGDLEKVRSIGLSTFIDAQLNPERLPESPIVTAKLAETASARLAPSSELIAQFVLLKKQRNLAQKGLDPNEPQQPGPQLPAPANNGVQESRARAKQQLEGANAMRRQVEGVIEAKLVRAVESPRQLNELLAEFWSNHFNVCMTKGLDRVLIGAYEEQAIRPYVLGNFRQLLGATMHHPAMIFYLDNAQNSKQGFEPMNPKSKAKGINENYARELLELHTLGVDGGYTQKDVTELARVLTGWGMPGERRGNTKQQYWAMFDSRRHDFGTKTVLGQKIEGTGAKEIEQVLDMLAVHPSTAHRVSYKLAQYFVDDNPPESLITKLSETYTRSGGNLKSVMKTLFASSEFFDPKYKNSKFKSPFHYTVSAYRATGAHVVQARRIQQFLKLQGQPLYSCLTPDGYKNTRSAWLNPDCLVNRIAFATQFASERQRQTPLDWNQLKTVVNGGKLSPKTESAIEKAPEFQKVAALISCPEFMLY